MTKTTCVRSRKIKYLLAFVFMVMCYFTQTHEHQEEHKNLNFGEHKEEIEMQNLTVMGSSCVVFSGSYLLPVLQLQGSKLRPIQSHLRLKFFPLRLKYLEKSQISSALSKQKGYQLPICCYFNKIKKEITKLFCFLP